ncbi:heterokaryon incompatibility protein-domain-containing protein [Earliella scabrosa]|nr:heterokaryon incompatibility protein-domain-containing protein [Earliella scabrosa]
MWLLDTHTLKLHHFVSPEAVKEGYAILSHVWNAQEQSFQDLQEVHEWCDRSGEDPHDFVTNKIRRFCELAELHGYRWGWIDTCCIDKTSSAELEEAINAMFCFYSLSQVCYVYLSDVVHRDPAIMRERAHDPDYRKSDDMAWSRWHKRGWTLQELIAPRNVHFLSRDWTFLGSKTDLAWGIERITGIPSSILKFEQRLEEISVARRMSWAAMRETTRIEDEAYCLMGMFGVSMSTLYGEGTRAFERLQQEIMRWNPDTTLFAWGARCDLDAFTINPEDATTGLLAKSPSDFGTCSAIIQDKHGASDDCSSLHASTSHTKRSLDVTMFTVTPHRTILSRIPVINIDGHILANLSWFEKDMHLLLILRRSPLPSRSVKSHPLYTIGSRDTTSMTPIRIAKVPRSNSNSGPRFQHTWVSLYLAHSTQIDQQMPTFYLPMNHSFPPFVRIDELYLRKMAAKRSVTNMEIVNDQLPWSGSPPLLVTFLYSTLDDSIYTALQVGVCKTARPSGWPRRLESIWANMQGSVDPNFRGDQRHHCPDDHVLTWPHLERLFTMKTDNYTPGELPRTITWLFTLAFTESNKCLRFANIDVDIDVLFHVTVASSV